MNTGGTTNPEKDIALERLVEAKGIVLAARGPKGFKLGRCPFAEHDDADALVIDPRSNTWRCTAGCGEGGVVAFVARAEGVSITHAEELLKSDFTPAAIVEPVKKSTTPKLPAVIEPDEPDRVVLDRVIAFYSRTLLDSPDAMTWLQEHGIGDPEALPHFRLGTCDRTLGYRIPAKNRKAGQAIRAQLERLGILRESGHEHFRGSIVVPVFDEAGTVVNVHGRKINDNLRTGTAMQVTLTDSDRGVLNPTGFLDGGKLIVTGSILDALVWWSNGHRNVTAGFGPDVKSRLVARKIRSVALALRRDDEGEKLATGIAEELRVLGVEVHQVVFPNGMDAADVAKAGKAPRDALDGLLRAARWVSAPAASPRPPMPAAATPEPAAGTGEVVIVHGDRRWRVRGLDDNTSHGSLRVNLFVARGDNAAFHVDTIELYSARQRGAFLAAAAAELNVEERILKKDLGSVLLQLEKIVDERLREALQPQRQGVPLAEGDREAALAFLRDPNLLDRIVADFDGLGIVGEKANKLVAYLAALSRKLPHPLAVVLQSAPAAGKSSLLDAVLRLVPDEDRLSFSAITGRSLYYLPADGLAHKVLALAEEEGAGDAAYALKLLHSEGSLSIASTAKETKTGRLVTHTYTVSGPVALLMTTTSLAVDEELLSRCLVLSVDEGRQHTKAIHLEQRRRLTLDGLVRHREVERVVKLHHDAQRLILPVHVVVPDALDLGFCDHRVRARRDFAKVLGLVQAVALLRQHQRTVRETEAGVRYVEATADDVAVAVRLVGEVLGRSLDELPPGTRGLLGALHGHVRAVAGAKGIDGTDVRFTRRELREALAVGDTQLRVHLARLVAMEYVVVHRSAGRVAYELLWSGEGEDGERFLPGTTTPACRGQQPEMSAPCRGGGGPLAGGCRGG